MLESRASSSCFFSVPAYKGINWSASRHHRTRFLPSPGFNHCTEENICSLQPWHGQSRREWKGSGNGTVAMGVHLTSLLLRQLAWLNLSFSGFNHKQVTLCPSLGHSASFLPCGGGGLALLCPISAAKAVMRILGMREVRLWGPLGRPW